MLIFYAVDHYRCSVSGYQLFKNARFTNKIMTKAERHQLRDKSDRMFQFGFENYMKHAYPMDELDPIHCVGRGHDHDDP